MKKKIVIIGGGFAGCELAKSLESVAEVTLVDPKDSFVHTPATIRAVVDPGLVDQLIIPYNDFIKEGRVIKGWINKIDRDGVILADGQNIDGDIIIVATGSEYAAPFKSADADLGKFRNAQKLAHEQLIDAKTIAIVGAGPVGTELAGEIASSPLEKEVHLISAETSLFPIYKPAFASKLTEQLEKLGVKIHLNSAVADLQSLTSPYAGSVKFERGGGVDADLVFPVVGSRPKASLLHEIDDVVFDTDGRAQHDGWMHPSPSRPNLFALGDILASGEAMTIVSISRQVPWLSKAIAGYIEGSALDAAKKYVPWPLAPILLPMGPEVGASMLPIGKQGLVAGPFVTRQMKGKHLFIPKYRKFFGA